MRQGQNRVEFLTEHWRGEEGSCPEAWAWVPWPEVVTCSLSELSNAPTPHTLEFLTGNKRLFLVFLAVEKVRNLTAALSFHATKSTGPELQRVNAFWKDSVGVESPTAGQTLART